MEAAAHSTMGDSLYAMGKYTDSLEAYEQDLTISSENVHESGCSRALTNLGRAHSAIGNYEIAIKLLSKTEAKEPLAKVFKEHEIGRCYLAMKTAGLTITNTDGESDAADLGETAVSHGMAAHDAAVAAGDNYWVVSAATLCAGAAGAPPPPPPILECGALPSVSLPWGIPLHMHASAGLLLSVGLGGCILPSMYPSILNPTQPNPTHMRRPFCPLLATPPVQLLRTIRRQRRSGMTRRWPPPRRWILRGLSQTSRTPWTRLRSPK